MILFVIEEVHLRWEERFHHPNEYVSQDSKYYDLMVPIFHSPQLSSYVTELNSILLPEENDIFCYVGVTWLVDRGYTPDKLKELEEDLPRIIAYLKNVQTAKAIEAL